MAAACRGAALLRRRGRPLGRQYRRPVPDHRGDAQGRFAPVVERTADRGSQGANHVRDRADRGPRSVARRSRGRRRSGEEGPQSPRHPEALEAGRRGDRLLGRAARAVARPLSPTRPFQHGAPRGGVRRCQHVREARASDGLNASRQLGGDDDQPEHSAESLRQGARTRPGPVHEVGFGRLHGPGDEHLRHARQWHHGGLWRRDHRAAQDRHLPRLRLYGVMAAHACLPDARPARGLPDGLAQPPDPQRVEKHPRPIQGLPPRAARGAQ